MQQSFLGFIEGEDAIDDRFQIGLGDGLVHGDKVGARADVNAMDANLAAEDGPHVDCFSGTRKHADLRDDAARADGAERAREGSLAADFDDQVHAFTAGLGERPFLPVGVLAVVEPGVEAESTGSGQLLIAG